MMEAGVLLDLDGHPIYWHTPNDRSGGALPDSRDLWEVIWENRANLLGFAHSHPGYGKPGPSHTDLTTFIAIEEGLGKHLQWWIASGDCLAVVLHAGERPDQFVVCQCKAPEVVHWLPELRRLSGFPI